MGVVGIETDIDWLASCFKGINKWPNYQSINPAYALFSTKKLHFYPGVTT